MVNFTPEYCAECKCFCSCHPCQHTYDKYDFMLDAGVPGYKVAEMMAEDKKKPNQNNLTP